VKSYQQYCALARGLDVIGDRWTPLIIREISLRDCRYSDIRDGLPGIASNLLADRLRSLVSAGLVDRFEGDKPVATPLYRLTQRGQDLLPALHAIARWAVPLMVEGPQPGDVQRGRWTAFAAEALLAEDDDNNNNNNDNNDPLLVQLTGDAEPVLIAVGPTGVEAAVERHASPDVVIEGSNWHQLGLLSGELSLPDAMALMDISGSRTSLRRLRRLVQRPRASRPIR
jgi:DNA-binding HxlR family transcriptional regulator